GGALLFNIAFCAIERSLHRSGGRLKVIPSESRGCNAAPKAFGAKPGFHLWILRIASIGSGGRLRFTASTAYRFNGSTLLMFLCRSLWWRRFVAKFAMPDFAAGVRDIPTGSQRHCGEKNYGDDEWC